MVTLAVCGTHLGQMHTWATGAPRLTLTLTQLPSGPSLVKCSDLAGGTVTTQGIQFVEEKTD